MSKTEHTGRTGRRIIRALYLRALGLIHLVALGSLWWQIDGLVGARGILPYTEYLTRVHDALGPEAAWRLPTVLWWWPTDVALHLVFAAGMTLALALAAGLPVEGPLLLGLWVVTWSIAAAGQQFLGFQWDSLLTEVTFAAMLVARWRPGGGDAPWWGWWVQWLVLARLMFFGGLVKLQSGDPTWADLTALTYHYFTQPLPNPLSWPMHQAPLAVHRAGVVATFVVELGGPWLILAGRRGRLGAFLLFAGLMAMLFATGNYGFFQLLTVVLCIPLLDDGALRPVTPEGLPVRLAARGHHPTSHLLAPLGALLFALGWIQGAVQLEWPVPVPLVAAYDAQRPFRTVNRYGLFAVMTTTRPEIVIQGTLDGESWRDYPLPAKPGDPSRRPPQVAPHHPRLDWQLWFAAMGTCRRNPWVYRLQERLVEGSEPVLALFADDPFDGERPRAVRTVRWDYRFAPPDSDMFWVRTELGPYCPPVTREGDASAEPSTRAASPTR